MNWKVLKDFANTLTEDQLEQPVHVWGEGFSRKVTGTMILAEDHINPSGDGAEPVSAYPHPDSPEFDPTIDIDVTDEPVVASKGEIWLEAE